MRTFIRAALVGAAMLVTIPAHAITFAEFSGASPNWFGYNGAATGGSLTGNTKVNFDGSAFGFDEVATNTTFKLTATSSTAPSAWASGMNATQIFQTGSLTFTASNAFAAAHGGLTNLLTVTFTNGALNVTPLGSKNVAFTVTDGEEQFDGSLSTISYSSDFFDFTGATDFDFAFSLTGATKAVEATANGGSLVNFKASGPGSFAAVAAIPEPDQWAMFLVGFGLVGSTMRRRRSMSVVSA